MLVATTMGHVKIDQVAKIMNSKNMTLKVMLQQSTNKFLFAQADSDFVDFLFSILILTLERLGSTGMSRFHRSATPNFENILLKCYKSFLTQYNYTDRQYYGRYDYFKIWTYTGRYVKGSMMYMVRDDLTVSPLEVTSGVCVIKELNVSLGDIKELKLQVGLEEVSFKYASFISVFSKEYGIQFIAVVETGFKHTESGSYIYDCSDRWSHQPLLQETGKGHQACCETRNGVVVGVGRCID